MSSQGLAKASGHARMWKMREGRGSKCMAFSVSLLSHASVTPSFMYGQLLHGRNSLEQVP